MDESKWNESKTIRCDNAKEQMAPLKDICWANGVLVEHVAPKQESRKIVLYGFKESKCNVRYSSKTIHRNKMGK
jgi:hypothetical protein